MAIPAHFEVFVRTERESSARRARLIASIVFSSLMLFCLVYSICKSSEEFDLLDGSADVSDGDEMKVMVTVPKGANPGQILRVLVPGHTGLVYAKVNLVTFSFQDFT